jgi:hypothetical protein
MSPNTVNLYFGHPVNTYNTDLELRLLELIRQYFEYNLKLDDFVIENPNQKVHADGYLKWKQEKGNGMLYYFEEVLPKQDGGIFLPFRDGMWGKGVFGEAEFLMKTGRIVWQIDHEGSIQIVKHLPQNLCLSVEETKARIYGPGGSRLDF